MPRYSFVHYLKVIDLFRKDVNMSYRGSEYFKTSFGAITTLVFLIFIMTYSLVQLSVYVNDPISSISRDLYPVIDNSVDINVELNCMFGFTEPLDPEIGSIRFLHNTERNGVRERQVLPTI